MYLIYGSESFMEADLTIVSLTMSTFLVPLSQVVLMLFVVVFLLHYSFEMILFVVLSYPCLKKRILIPSPLVGIPFHL